MSYRNKTYVCFDGDADIQYYRLMCAWKQNDGIPFAFYDAHDLNTARDSSQEESIKRQLRARLGNSAVLVVLIGPSTRYQYRFVKWEIEQAISLGLPVIAVNVNGLRYMDHERCPAILRGELAVHVSFNARIIQYALENWPSSHSRHKAASECQPFSYKQSVYASLGL